MVNLLKRKNLTGRSLKSSESTSSIKDHKKVIQIRDASTKDQLKQFVQGSDLRQLKLARASPRGVSNNVKRVDTLTGKSIKVTDSIELQSQRSGGGSISARSKMNQLL